MRIWQLLDLPRYRLLPFVILSFPVVSHDLCGDGPRVLWLRVPVSSCLLLHSLAVPTLLLRRPSLIQMGQYLVFLVFLPEFRGFFVIIHLLKSVFSAVPSGQMSLGMNRRCGGESK